MTVMKKSSLGSASDALLLSDMFIEEIVLPISPLGLLGRLQGEKAVAYVDGVTGSDGRRFTIIGFNPRSALMIHADGSSSTGFPWCERMTTEPLAAFDRFLAALPRPGSTHPFPLRVGAIGYLAYEFSSLLEPRVLRAVDDLRLPRLVFAFYDPLVIYDAGAHRYHIVSTTRHDAERCRAELLERAAAAPAHAGEESVVVGPTLRSNMTVDEYRHAIGRIHHHIAAGDVYQISLTQRFNAPMHIGPVELFTRLARTHPTPRSAYFDAGDFQIVSNSPELFLERRGCHIATRPIKGTRRRGRTVEEDVRLRRELETDPKERAEHVMIVDLERNDLGRICLPGSVHVHPFAALESYPSLHHLVSTVEGELRADVGTVEILRATFPGGSVTGAPKIRAMELIDELEPNARGVYTGALGLIDGAGDFHLNLPIRTAVTMEGRAYFGAGGGIVADSDADAERAETLLKLEAILGALGSRTERAA